VVIPEGLPLVITLSLAYSVQAMKDDGLVIKRLDCPEINATINQIIIGKTGTLTTGDLKVRRFWVHG
jgi:P-type E1-E2 ATPase